MSFVTVFTWSRSVRSQALHSFPTRRSSDLQSDQRMVQFLADLALVLDVPLGPHRGPGPEDRKSTRLNSSHLGISYDVFCLKKKTDHNGLPVRFNLAADVSQRLPLHIVAADD